jgi:hypothetical protein
MTRRALSLKDEHQERKKNNNTFHSFAGGFCVGVCVCVLRSCVCGVSVIIIHPRLKILKKSFLFCFRFSQAGRVFFSFSAGATSARLHFVNWKSFK